MATFDPTVKDQYAAAGPSLAPGGFSGGGTVAPGDQQGELDINYGGKSPWSLYSGYGNETPWGSARYLPTEQGWRPLFNAPGSNATWQNYYQQQPGMVQPQQQPIGGPAAQGAPAWWQNALQYRNAQVGDLTGLGTIIGEDPANYLVKGPGGIENYYSKYYYQKQAMQAPAMPGTPGQPPTSAPPKFTNLSDLFPEGTIFAGGSPFNEMTGKFDNLPQGYSFSPESGLNNQTGQDWREITGPEGNFLLNTASGELKQPGASDTLANMSDVAKGIATEANTNWQNLGFDEVQATSSMNSIAAGLAAAPGSPEYSAAVSAINSVMQASDADGMGTGFDFPSYEAAAMAVAMGLPVSANPNSPSGWSIMPNQALMQQNQELLDAIDQALMASIASAAPTPELAAPDSSMPSGSGLSDTGVMDATEAAVAEAATVDAAISEAAAADAATASASTATAADVDTAAGVGSSGVGTGSGPGEGPAGGGPGGGPGAGDTGAAADGPGTGDSSGPGPGGDGGPGGGPGGDGTVLFTWLRKQGAEIPTGLFDNVLGAREKLKKSPEGRRQITRYLAVGSKVIAKLDAGSPRLRAAARQYLEKNLLGPIGPTFTPDETEKARKLFREALLHLADALEVKYPAQWVPGHKMYKTEGR